MIIRGNNTFIDHGQGVISGYGHQAEINVATGDFVQEGQIIGIIGKSGRVTGPHLHWDIFVNGTPVDPFDWLENVYP
jgi:murein DD-endopeptidase MepM/ murein hydrolase activator NlpD